jgi:beta-lactamase regulating signal transducer with metallopeptidase domain
MNALAAADLLAALLRTTLALSATYLLARGALRLTKSSSPLVHRAACVLALAQGWWFARLAIDVPWYDPPARRPLPAAPILEAAEPPIVAESTTSEALVAEVGAEHSTSVWQWQTVVVALWLAGALVAVVREAVHYLRFARNVPLGAAPAPEDEAEWLALQAQCNVRRPIPLRMTEDLGPLLCRFPGGYRLLAPRHAWRELSPEARMAVLRHELAHYERGDVWKSLAARILALPQWFNPLAWLAVRHFDEAAEWACDAAACGAAPEDAPAYGKALLSLAVGRAQHTVLNTAAQGRGLALRIGRILAPNSIEDSKMKKTLWMAVAAIVLFAGGIEWRVVARAAEDQVDRSNSPEHEKAVQLLLETAKQAWDVTAAEYDNGTVTLEMVYLWSRRLLEAERIAAKNKDDEIAALARHWKRMHVLYIKTKALFDAGARGGETQKVKSTSFYVAEAELWLANAGSQAPGDSD